VLYLAVNFFLKRRFSELRSLELWLFCCTLLLYTQRTKSNLVRSSRQT